MSTTIYNAFKFKKKPSIDELSKIIEQWRKEIKDLAEIEYAKIILREYTYLSDLKLVHGNTKIDEMIELNKDDRDMINILTQLKNDNYTNLLFYLHMNLSHKLHESKNKLSSLNNILKCEMIVYTLPYQTLFMMFGNQQFINYIAEKDNVVDYHYQNQSDRPKNIKKDAWTRRLFAWDKAIGPDYVPMNHGLSANFINTEDIQFGIMNNYTRIKNIREELFPDMEHRIESILDTFNAPNAPVGESYSKWKKYTKTKEYIDWKEEKTKELLSILPSNMVSTFTKQCSKE